MTVLAAFLCLVGVASASVSVPYSAQWTGGGKGEITLHASHNISGWRMHIVFDSDIANLEIWDGFIVAYNQREYIIVNTSLNGVIPEGQSLTVPYVVRMKDGETDPPMTAFVEGMNDTDINNMDGGSVVGGGTQTGTGSTGVTTGTGGNQPMTGGSPMKYDYREALKLSILFYDAQRSGRLPSNNPIPWRGDSAVSDGDNGHDLSGGWYDAGDHVKFNLPMAYSTWVLGWGFLKFKEGYQSAGQVNMMCDSIKWPLDYFLKCWIPGEQTLYVQVGDGNTDHGYWGRPENMNMWRPAFKINAGCPGSDVAGDTVSALAAGSMIFSQICGDTGYASRLLDAAKSLYTFAKQHRGIYSNCVTQAKDFYGSTSEQDNMAVAATFMFEATKDQGYLNDAKGWHQAGVAWALSWDDTKVAADLRLYDLTKDSQYIGDVQGFVSSYMDGGSVAHTPCGLAFRDQWGANRYAGNAAFMATMAAASGINADQYKKFAMSQINYILGDNKYHISYEVGFGQNYPTHVHHRGSSCPTYTTSCDGNSGSPNPNLLKGALVGGPDQGDNYEDRRSDYVKNEVACDYNAGFQGALAGLTMFAQNNNLPAAPGARC